MTYYSLNGIRIKTSRHRSH